jgi:hypothetical protein
VYLLWANDSSQTEQERRIGWICFVNLFHSLGFKNKKLIEYEKDGREKILRGQAPWGLSIGPITKNRVVHAFEQFQYEIESKKIIEGAANNGEYMDEIWQMAFKRKYWFDARKILEKSNSADFEKYRKRFETRFNELIQRAVRKSGLNSE